MKRGRGETAVAALVLVFAALAFNAACDRRPGGIPAGETRQITVGVNPWPASAALLVAHEKGYFREQGLEVILRPYSSGHLALEALFSGRVDFATAAESPIARAAVDGKHFSVVATIAEIDNGVLIVARKDRGVLAPDDLRGKKIGRAAGTAADFFLDLYLKTSYIHPKDVRVVDLAPENIVSALLDGDVDAVSTWAPQTTALREALGNNGRVLHEPGLYIMSWNLVAATELAQRDPDTISRFLRAVVRANRLIADRPGEAIAITAEKCGMAIPALEREWSDFEFSAHLEESLLLSLEDEARWMIRKRAGGAANIPRLLDRIDAKGLRAADPDAVRLFREE